MAVEIDEVLEDEDCDAEDSVVVDGEDDVDVVLDPETMTCPTLGDAPSSPPGQV